MYLPPPQKFKQNILRFNIYILSFHFKGLYQNMHRNLMYLFSSEYKNDPYL